MGERELVVRALALFVCFSGGGANIPLAGTYRTLASPPAKYGHCEGSAAGGTEELAKGSPSRTPASASVRRCFPDSPDAPWLLQGFVAKPLTLPDGTQDILNWEVIIPGKDNTLWEGARIPMTMQFSEDYPNKPPYAVPTSKRTCAHGL